MVTDIKDRTFDFSVRVVRLCQLLNAAPGASRTVANQLLRSGTSIGANVEEAHGSQSNADFIAKMCIACKEAPEIHYWLRLLVATDLIANTKLALLLDESNQLVAILTSIVKKARQSRPKHA